MIDPRGPRFAATLTSLVLAVVLLSGGSPLGTLLLALQAVVFGVGAFAGLQRAPYGVLYRRFVRPRLAPPTDLEPEAPPRFAQLVGLAFALLATAAFTVGADTLGLVAVGLALGAAFLNAAFGFCLGCEVYLLARRVVGTRAAAAERA